MVKCWQVSRASRDPAMDDHTGFTYKHAPDLVWWRGRFYIQYLCNPQGEHSGRGVDVLASSSDGRHWEGHRISRDPGFPYRGDSSAAPGSSRPASRSPPRRTDWRLIGCGWCMGRCLPCGMRASARTLALSMGGASHGIAHVRTVQIQGKGVLLIRLVFHNRQLSHCAGVEPAVLRGLRSCASGGAAGTRPFGIPSFGVGVGTALAPVPLRTGDIERIKTKKVENRRSFVHAMKKQSFCKSRSVGLSAIPRFLCGKHFPARRTPLLSRRNSLSLNPAVRPGPGQGRSLPPAGNPSSRPSRSLKRGNQLHPTPAFRKRKNLQPSVVCKLPSTLINIILRNRGY